MENHIILLRESKVTFFFQNLTWEYIHLPSPGHFTNPTGVVATVSDINVRFPYWWRHKNSSVGLLDVSGNLELSVVNITTSVLPGKVTAIQWPVLTGQVYSVLRGHPVSVYLWTFLQCHCERKAIRVIFRQFMAYEYTSTIECLKDRNKFNNSLSYNTHLHGPL